MLEKVRKNIDEIISICNEVPDKYQEKCFEILLNSLIFENEKQKILDNKDNISSNKFNKSPLPIQVRSFLQKHLLSEDLIDKLFIIEEDVHPTYNYKIENVGIPTNQKNLSLLLSLENAIKNGKFEFSKQKLKDYCKLHNSYDVNHFSEYIKKSSKMYSETIDEDILELSLTGQEELSNLIKELTNAESQ